MSDISFGKTPEEKAERLELLYRVGMALGAVQDKDRLVEMILLEAKKLCHADGGTLYLRTDDDQLAFSIMRTDSLGFALGGTTGKSIDLPPIPMYDEAGAPNRKNVASSCALDGTSVNIPDAYDAEGFDFSGTKKFDEHNQYRSKSFLCIPMRNHEDRVIGVLQLLNAKDPASGETVAFGPEDQAIVEALAAQAGIALDNQLLLDGQKQLLIAFIKLIASAIDAKSPYTGGHCERVPLLTEMLAKAACEATDGPFKDFSLDNDEWYELEVAAGLHDCGKVVTPVHIMDKATKLEAIFDRLNIVQGRYEVKKRDAKIAYLEALAAGDDETAAKATYDAECTRLDEDFEFIRVANIGGEFMSDDKKARIAEIAKETVSFLGEEQPMLTENEVYNLQIARGTLTNEERLIINGHMVQTIKMLEALPFPRNLKRVPEYAGGHHEKMDGSGYPKGIYAGDMSIPARMMAIADVFEALTAQDRPYKNAKTLSESMRIMGFMKKDSHLDPDLLDFFVTSGVYKAYAAEYLPPELIDEVDEAAILAIKPAPYELPPEGERKKRWADFLPEYENQK